MSSSGQVRGISKLPGPHADRRRARFMNDPNWVDIATLIVTVGGVVIALGYTIATYLLLRESQRFREDQSEPNLVGYIGLLGTPDEFDLVVENIGKSPAFDCSVQMGRTLEKYLLSINDKLTSATLKFDVVGPGEQRHVIRGQGMKGLAQLSSVDREIAITFKTLRGITRCTRAPIDPSSTFGRPMYTRIPMDQVALSLEQIERHVARMAR